MKVNISPQKIILYTFIFFFSIIVYYQNFWHSDSKYIFHKVSLGISNDGSKVLVVIGVSDEDAKGRVAEVSIKDGRIDILALPREGNWLYPRYNPANDREIVLIKSNLAQNNEKGLEKIDDRLSDRGGSYIYKYDIVEEKLKMLELSPIDGKEIYRTYPIYSGDQYFAHIMERIYRFGKDQIRDGGDFIGILKQTPENRWVEKVFPSEYPKGWFLNVSRLEYHDGILYFYAMNPESEFLREISNVEKYNIAKNYLYSYRIEDGYVEEIIVPSDFYSITDFCVLSKTEIFAIASFQDASNPSKFKYSQKAVVIQSGTGKYEERYSFGGESYHYKIACVPGSNGTKFATFGRIETGVELSVFEDGMQVLSLPETDLEQLISLSY